MDDGGTKVPPSMEKAYDGPLIAERFTENYTHRIRLSSYLMDNIFINKGAESTIKKAEHPCSAKVQSSRKTETNPEHKEDRAKRRNHPAGWLYYFQHLEYLLVPNVTITSLRSVVESDVRMSYTWSCKPRYISMPLWHN